jgi:UDP-glucose 4-epimerase
MKKVLVTGGAGFIGSAVIAKLQSLGHEIFVIDNLSFGNRSFINVPDSHFYLEDILNAESIESIIQSIQPDWCIHLAAIHFIPYCNQHPFESSRINIQGTENILNALKKTKVEKVLFASTAAVYPISDDPISEKSTPNPVDIYGLSKLTGEYLMKKFHLETKIPAIVCRFFNAIGHNETNPHLFPDILSQIKEGKREIHLGNLTPKRDFIHIDDMASAVNALLVTFKEGYDIFNLGRGKEYSVLEIVKAFEKAVNEPIEVVVDESRVRKVERQHLCANIEKLKSATGWKPLIEVQEAVIDLYNRN